MTDVDPFENLRAYADQIADAKRRVTDLEDERNAAIIAALGDEPAYGAISATAKAARLSRQHIDRILRMARARRADPQ